MSSFRFSHFLLYIFLIFFILFSITACEQRTEYQRLVERELAKGVRNDSLFLGYKFGMEKEDFFDHSWNLNQQNIITGGTHVVFKIDTLSSTATMNFFPEFYDNKIYKMPIEVQYDSWAPWNRQYFSDSLIVELLDVYEEIYGQGFVKMAHPEVGKESWIKVNGNRRISIYQEDDMKARIEFLDLSVSQDNQ